MPKYEYKATDADGNIREGVLEAANLDELEMHLDQLNLMLISQKVDKRGKSLFARKKSAITRRDLIVFCFNMEQTVRSGVPVIDGLESLRSGLDQPNTKVLITSLLEDIRAGRRLSEAIASHPDSFSSVFTQLIRVGEQTGNLADIFLDLSENLKWEDELIAQAKKVMTYPLIVGVVVTVLVFFLMIYLVPQLMAFITEMGGELPMHTRALIATSDFVVDWWHVILLTPFILYVLVRFGTSVNTDFQRLIDRLKFKIWLFGPLMRKIILVRFSKTFSLMYKSGIPVLDGIKTSEGLSENLVMREAMAKVRQMISDGKGITDSFRELNFFPPLVLNMLQVGESSGNLDRSMLNVSYFFDREVKETISKLESMIEPVMTGILGGIIGWVVLSVLGPIYDLIETL